MNELLEEGIIRHQGKLKSSDTGRKTDIFSRSGSHASVLVINLTLEDNSIALVDLELNICHKSPISLENFDSEYIAETLKPVIETYIGDDSNSLKSLVLALPHHPYDKEKLKTLLSRIFPLPIYTINNVEAMGLYDSRFYYKPFNSLVYIFVGSGIGSAFFHKGELLMGENGLASNLGHIHITDNPIPCRCGRMGCLEAVASENAMSLSLKNLSKTESNARGDELISLIQSFIDDRDETIQDLITRVASYLAESILTVISLLDPQAIILSGRITALNPFLSQKLEEHLYSKSGRKSLYRNKLIYGNYKPDSPIKGAAQYAFSSAFAGYNKE